MLSVIHLTKCEHISIKSGSGWYKVESGSDQCKFANLNILVTYYRSNIISNELKITLGAVCIKTSKEDQDTG